MKEFRTNFQGLLPIFLNDLRFMQSSYQEQIEAILKPFMDAEPAADGGFILDGCVVTGQIENWSVSAGWVVLAGKLYRVPAHAAPYASPYAELYWEISEFEMPEGEKQPKRTTNTVQSHIDKVAKLVETSQSSPARYSDTPRFENVLKYMTTPDPVPDTGWVTVNLASGLTAIHTVMYRKIGNVVYLKGLCRYDSAPGLGDQFPVPVTDTIIAQNPSDADVIAIIRKTDGHLIFDDAPESGDVLFDGLTYLTD